MVTFRAQLERLNAFFTNPEEARKIELAAASRSTVSSTSLELRPCLSVNLYIKDRGYVCLTVPAGTSAGVHEPSGLTRKGEFQAAEKKVFDEHVCRQLINQIPDPMLVDQALEAINDRLPIRADGMDTPFSKIGGPTATATSLATVLGLARAAGVGEEVAIHHVYNRIARSNDLPPAPRLSLPIYMSKIADGGVHGALDNQGHPLNPVQEFLFIPIGYEKYTDALEVTMQVNARFWNLMRDRNFDLRIGAEGGIVSSQLTSAIQVLQLMCLAIRGDGRDQRPFPGVFIGLDVAAGELYGYPDAPNRYYLGKDGHTVFGSDYVDHEQLTEYYRGLIRAFPIISIEDPFADVDECLPHWEHGFSRLSQDVLVITDDMSVTQPDRVKMAVNWGVGGLLTKVNQGGTFTRTCLAMQIAHAHRWIRVLSHRSSEAADFNFEAMFAVAAGAEFLKVTVGSTKGGGGGREARVNWVSNANVRWNAMWQGIGAEGHSDHGDWVKFWSEDTSRRDRLEGLPYQGALLMKAQNPPPWLSRTQALIATRFEQAENSTTPIHKRAAYRFGSVSSEAILV